MRRSIATRLGLTAATALTAVAAFPAGTAHAATPSCPSGYFCAWTNDSYEGERAEWNGNDSWWGDGSQAFINDNAESVYNRETNDSADGVRLYEDIGYVGYAMCVSRGDYFDWGLVGEGELSSHKQSSSC